MLEQILRNFFSRNSKVSEDVGKLEQMRSELNTLTLELTRKEYLLRRRYQLTEKENKILSKILNGSFLYEVINELTNFIEGFGSNIVGSILCNRDGVLIDKFSPNLSKEYTDKINEKGFPVDPSAGSCGAAAYYRDTFIVEDIEEHPNWTKFPEIQKAALNQGFKACWSKAVLDSKQNLLGTVALYCYEKGSPSEENLEILDWCTKVAGIVIEREIKDERIKYYNKEIQQSNKAIEDKNKILEAIIHASGGHIWYKDVEGKYVFCDESLRTFFFGYKNKHAILGHTDEELLNQFEEENETTHEYRSIIYCTEEHSERLGEQTKYIVGGKVGRDLIVMEMIKTPLINHKGEFYGTVGAAWERTNEINLLMEDIEYLGNKGRIEKLSEKDYPETPFIYYIKPCCNHSKTFLYRPIVEL